MRKNTGKLEIILDSNQEKWSPLEEVLRDGARKMLQMALESEIHEFNPKNAVEMAIKKIKAPNLA